MAVKTEKIYVANPHKFPSRVAASRKGKGERPNPSPGLVMLGYVNPEGAKMAKAKTGARGGHKAAHAAHRNAGRKKGMKSNPSRKGRSHRGHKKSHGRRNPSGRGAVGGAMTALKMGIFALVNLVITRQVPQAVLGANNSGLVGYGANLVTALGGSWLIGKFAGREAGQGALIGGGLYVANRIIQDKLSPVGQYLSLSGGAGLGDYNALGEIVTDGRAYFPLPVAWDAGGMNPIIPKEIRPPVAMALSSGNGKAVAMPAAGVGYASRFVSRFDRRAA
jgi:hypothetical protein